ncbi:MAG TPA: hypothetical protein VIV06_05680, partial [Candidatus Limnocylindrales bacterium]
MGDLEEVEPGQAPGDEGRIDVLLEVAREQESLLPERAEQDNRDVVDASAGFRRLPSDRAGVRPQDAEIDIVHVEPVPRRESSAPPAARDERRRKSRVAGSLAEHSGFDDGSDPVTLEEDGKAAHVVVVGMGEDEEVDPPVPGRQALVELGEQ